MPVTGELFKEVFQRWPSGVAIATTVDTDGSRYGMIVGSFCSLSREPPLVMMSAGTTTQNARCDRPEWGVRDQHSQS